MTSLSVSQFVEFLNAALDAAVFPSGAAVEGEVAEYRVSQGKWIWFKLKDDKAVIDCFAAAWQLRQPLEDGLRLRAFGHPRLFARSGKFTLNVERVEPVGEGALRRAYELLKARLAEEGLFATARKRAIPRFPRRIGLIASGESAAYGDFLRILGNRWGGIAVDHFDVQVQGPAAPDQIAAAFRHFNASPGSADVIVLTRGGGSLEDLAAFNSEPVVRAVFSSKIPVIVGVGHERDETLADLAADVRASTPSNAAEIAVPDRREIATSLSSFVRALGDGATGLAAGRSSAVAASFSRLSAAMAGTVRAPAATISRFEFQAASFSSRLAAAVSAVSERRQRLVAAVRSAVSRSAGQLAAAERLIRGLDPRRLLERGYAMVRKDGRIVRDVRQVDLKDRLAIQLAHGSLTGEVIEKSE